MSHTERHFDNAEMALLLDEECSYCRAAVGQCCDPDCQLGAIDPSYTREEEFPSVWEPPPPPGW
ncbi:hypothetical protein ACIP93_31465 [Streptomyces sp. NPDC088745]|uniref:hypothetical protein n=1 Tax=Streptomyces sp. NPDC088745 TaxID=3365884 RepID=UPI003822A1CB